ncbi:MAG: hypothetical protein IPM56_17900 [Ignavibacteriales bacterium]|nr:MAG: hypothetical protein IPM56_17900 [Ignavibacteriales bacterium]
MSFLIFYSLASIQFYFDFKQYLDIKENGITTNPSVSYKKKFGAWFYSLEFVTLNNVHVIKEGKCGELRKCKKYYDNIIVIFNPENPHGFMELPDYENYSIEYKIFFYFILYGITGSYLLYLVLNVIIMFKSKENRNKFFKIIKRKQI